MIVVIVICCVILLTAGFLVLLRMTKGPTMLDRMVSSDIMLTVVIGAVGLEAVWHRRTEAVPILVALSLIGFIGSVTVARFASVEPEERRRIMSRAEEAAADAAILAAERREAERIAERLRAKNDERGEDSGEPDTASGLADEEEGR